MNDLGRLQESVGTQPVSFGQVVDQHFVGLQMVYFSAASAMRALYQYFDAYSAAQQVVLGTKVYLATIDVCLKALAGYAGPTSKRLFKEKNLRGAIIDEFQRLPEFTGHAILSALPEAVFVGDWCQELPAPFSGILAHRPWKPTWQAAAKPPDANPLAPAPKRPRSQGDVGPGELRNPKPRWAAELPSADNHRATMHYLTAVKRNGAPLCKFVATYFSDLCPDFVASDVAPSTVIRHVIYFTDKFEPLRQLLVDIKRTSTLRMIPPHLHASVVWNSGLFAALGARIIRQLHHEAQRLPGNARVSDAIILVGFALSRLLKPFARYLSELLNWEPVKTAVAPLTFANVTVRVANDCTGPTFKFVCYVRHCRYVGQSDQHMGIQSDEKLEYVMYTRAQEELVVFLQDTHGTPENVKQIYTDRGGVHPSAVRLAKCLETIKKLGTPYVLLDLEGTTTESRWANLRDDALWPDESWQVPHWQAIQWAMWTANWMRSSHDQTALVVKGVCDGPASSLILDERMDEVLKSSMFAEPVDTFQKKNLARTWQHVEHRAPPNFGSFSLPALPLQMLAGDSALVLSEAATWTARLVSAVSVMGFGHQSASVAIPTLAGLPGIAAMPYDASDARGNNPLRVLVRLIYLVLKVCAQPARLNVASVLHKANFKDDSRSDATLWWVKHCGSN